MTEPVSWQAIEWVAARLALIRAADGYYNTITNISTETGQQFDTLPALHVVGLQFDPQDDGSEDLSGVIEAFIAVGENDQLTAHRLIADISRALPGRVPREEQILKFTGFNLGSKTIEVPENADTLTLTVNFTIQLATS